VRACVLSKWRGTAATARQGIHHPLRELRRGRRLGRAKALNAGTPSDEVNMRRLFKRTDGQSHERRRRVALIQFGDRIQRLAHEAVRDGLIEYDGPEHAALELVALRAITAAGVEAARRDAGRLAGTAMPTDPPPNLHRSGPT
jgi:hypothetical protein